jgi:hypothetical protein
MIPSWRQNSMVRTLTSSILAGLSLFSRCSTSSVATPRRPISRQRKPDGTAARDQNRDFDSGVTIGHAVLITNVSPAIVRETNRRPP